MLGRYLSKHPGFAKYFFNTSWLLAEKILRVIVGALVGVLIARYLGPKDFGTFSFVVSYASLFGSFAALGLDSLLVRELLNKAEMERELLGTAFIIKMFGAIMTFGVLFGSLIFTTHSQLEKTMILIVGLSFLLQPFQLLEFYFQAKVKIKLTAICNVIVVLFCSVIKLVLIYTHAPLIAFTWPILIEASLLAIGYFMFFWNSSAIKPFQWRFRVATAKQFLKEGAPLILSGVFVTLYMKIDQIMIESMVGAEAVGYYAAAVRLSEAWYFIPVAISASLFPTIINAKKRGGKDYQIRLQKFYDMMFWGAFLIAVPMSFLSNPLIVLLFGEAYRSAAPILSIHIWATIPVFLGVASGKWLLAEHLTLLGSFRHLSGVVVNILLNLVMIKYYGALGAAISTLISYLVPVFVFMLVLKKTRTQGLMLIKTVNIFRIIKTWHK